LFFSRDLVLYEIRNSFWRLIKGILTKFLRNQIQLTKDEKSILIGMLISDGWVQSRKGWNPRIGYSQSIINSLYLLSLFTRLSHLCSGIPYISFKRNKLFVSLGFQTRQLASLKEIYNLFYNSDNLKKKIISPNLIYYMNEIVLAHWIMGDGAKRNKGIILCTDSFTIQEVVLLINILYIKFNIQATVHMDNHKPRIYINKKEFIKISSKVVPHIISSMRYKLRGLDV
jgi:LAGLIDADG DNA endonuclease family protein